MNRPYAAACDENRAVILDVIGPYLDQGIDVLEIGSGTGQHAVFFAENYPHSRWQTSDLEENLPGIESWLSTARTDNLARPIVLDVNGAWPEGSYDMVFSANSLHIMGEGEVVRFFDGCGRLIRPCGWLVVYGPFNYRQNYTSESNRRFDQWLKARDLKSGIKNFEWLLELAGENDLELVQDIAMPANNRTLIWQRAET